MYLQSGNVLHTLHFIDARRLLELQQYQLWMEKQQLSLCDPFEPIRRLAMVEHGSRNPEKPLTSFRINDILADASDSESSEVTEGKSSTTPQDNDHFRRPERNHNQRAAAARSERKSNSSNDNNDNQPYEQQEQNIIRPWNLSPKSGTSSDTDKDESQRNARIANRNYLLKLCNKSRRCEYESDDEEEIDVEGCDDEDSDTSLNSSDKDVSPLDALMAMSSKTFMGLESFGKKQSNTFLFICFRARIDLLFPF